MKGNDKEYYNSTDFAKMAKDYHLEDNALFLQTLKNYETVQSSIGLIQECIEQSEATVSKEYVKGRENIYIHPLIKELPKQMDVANKTAKMLLDIIERLGVQKTSNALMEYINN